MFRLLYKEIFSSMWLVDVHEQPLMLTSGNVPVKTNIGSNTVSDCQTEAKMNIWKFSKSLYQEIDTDISNISIFLPAIRYDDGYRIDISIFSKYRSTTSSYQHCQKCMKALFCVPKYSSVQRFCPIEFYQVSILSCAMLVFHYFSQLSSVDNIIVYVLVK